MELFQVHNNPEEQRYEVRIGDDIAFLMYEQKESQTIFLHTHVPPSLEGQGIGSAIARQALTDALNEKRWLIPLCPFIRGYLLQHPDYQDNPAYYQLLGDQRKSIQELLLRARSMVIEVVPEQVVEIPMIGEQSVGYAEKGGKFTDNLCWFTIRPEGLSLYFNEEVYLSHRENLPDGYVSIGSASELDHPGLRSLILAAWEAVE